MTIKLILTLFIFSIIFCFFIYKILKKNIMSASSVVLWLFFGLFIITIPIFHPFYKLIAYEVFGLEDATIFIFLVIIAFLSICIIYLSSKIKILIDKVQMLITHIAILENKYEKDRNE